jgi:hypothetical protein
MLGATTLGDQIHLELVILGVSVIGGFIARRLLPILGENLVYRVNENERKISLWKRADHPYETWSAIRRNPEYKRSSCSFECKRTGDI